MRVHLVHKMGYLLLKRAALRALLQAEQQQGQEQGQQLELEAQVRKLKLPEVHMQLLDARWSTEQLSRAAATAVDTARDMAAAKKAKASKRQQQREQHQEQGEQGRKRRRTHVQQHYCESNSSSSSNSSSRSHMQPLLHRWSQVASGKVRVACKEAHKTVMPYTCYNLFTVSVAGYTSP